MVQNLVKGAAARESGDHALSEISPVSGQQSKHQYLSAEFPISLRTLAIVPCSKAKIWQRYPSYGVVAAQDAYTSPLFRLHRRYAEEFARKFSHSDLNHSRIEYMRSQAMSIPIFERVILLGGFIYRQVALKALSGIYLKNEIAEPFSGLDLLQTIRGLKLALGGRGNK
jgi:hypothetical protein